MIVLDTNVISEALRARPAEVVGRWIAAHAALELFTTAICEAEILYGVAVLPAGRRRDALAQAVTAIFAEDLAGRVLPFDSAAAKAFATIAAARRRLGHPISEADARIAAIAACNRAVVATRNVADFANCGIDIVDPWQASAR